MRYYALLAILILSTTLSGCCGYYGGCRSGGCCGGGSPVLQGGGFYGGGGCPNGNCNGGIGAPGTFIPPQGQVFGPTGSVINGPTAYNPPSPLTAFAPTDPLPTF